VIKLLTLLLSLLDRVFTEWGNAKLRQQGRQEAVKEMNDEIDRQIEMGAAAAAPDPVRDQRLRARFDAAAD